jgi:hypothetical protein
MKSNDVFLLVVSATAVNFPENSNYDRSLREPVILSRGDRSSPERGIVSILPPHEPSPRRLGPAKARPGVDQVLRRNPPSMPTEGDL